MSPRHALTAALAVAVVAAALVAARGPAPIPLGVERPLGRAWRVIQPWDESLEDEYARFVAAIGAAVKEWRCTRLDECLADPAANLLHDGSDERLRLEVDCADLPYVLRAYFAYKRGLPFGFLAGVRAPGVGDLRYAPEVRPAEWRSFRDYPTARALLRDLVRRVHTGTFRIPAELDSDFYPVRIDRRSVRPGTVFYDPLGHVSVVAEVRDDGDVWFLEGTPDGNLTWRRFGSGNRVGEAALGGGFKRFRPQALVRGRIVRSLGDDLDAESQHDVSLRVIGGGPVSYHEWVRHRLAVASVIPDPLVEAREQIQGLCRQVRDRIEAVELAVEAGLPRRRHPGTMPPNVYVARGAWEAYSTPARDARLKDAVRELARHVRGLEDLAGLAPALRELWRVETASPHCRFAYRDSRGEEVPLTLDRVIDRLFDLSFDPYHCPELRWGAPPGSLERASCPEDPDKESWYAAQRRLRNRIDRDLAAATPLDDGPEAPPAGVDPRPYFAVPRVGLDL